MARFSARPTIPPSAMCASFRSSLLTIYLSAAALASASGSGLSCGRMTSGPGPSKTSSRVASVPRLFGPSLAMAWWSAARGARHHAKIRHCFAQAVHAVLRGAAPSGAQGRAGRAEPGQDAVLEVELGALHQGPEVVGVEQVLCGQVW